MKDREPAPPDGGPPQPPAEDAAGHGPEAALRGAEARYRALAEIGSDAIVVTDESGIVLSCNPAVSAVLGYAPAELVGRPLERIVPERHRAAYRRRMARFLARPSTGGVSRRMETEGLRRDGTEVALEISFGEYRDAGRRYLVGFLRDVTDARRARRALRERERYFRSLIEHASDAITILDAEGTIRFGSPSVEQVLGWPPAELLGTDAFAGVHPDDREGVLEAFRQGLEDPGRRPQVGYRFRTRAGEWREVESTGTNLLDDPAVRGMVVHTRDLTERKRLEEQLRQAQKMEAVGRLAGGVAHDFNNLLTVIGGHAQMVLERTPADSPDRADLQAVAETVHRAGALTQQLLAFSRKQVLEPQPLDAGRVLTRMDGILRRLIGEDVELRLELAPEPCPILADPTQVEQIVMNLAVNARDAMPRGGRLALRTRRARRPACPGSGAPDEDAPEQVCIEVADTGEGMDPHVLRQAFEPFFTTKGVGEGTGLGLSTVYGIVRQSGGSVTVESEPGRGTVFRVFLPLHPGPAPAPGEAAPAPPRGGTETVLLVEDDRALRSLARVILERSGYRVLAARGGEEALSLAAAHGGDVHLLLTDVVMPGVSGRELADRFAAERPDTRVLFMSGYPDDAVLRHGVGRGRPFLPKPFTPASLLGRVREALDAPAR